MEQSASVDPVRVVRSHVLTYYRDTINQGRICFAWRGGNAEQVEIVDYH